VPLGYFNGSPISRYVVRRHDTLRRISRRFLNDEMRWPTIYRLNRWQIRDPDLIYPGQRFRVVPNAAALDAERTP
jgi:nucleoid-associated protein YgaU